jgi:hypothetical protein
MLSEGTATTRHTHIAECTFVVTLDIVVTTGDIGAALPFRSVRVDVITIRTIRIAGRCGLGNPAYKACADLHYIGRFVYEIVIRKEILVFISTP